MNISKKIMTSVLAVSMLASMAVPTYAAEENEVTDPLPNTGDTQVTLEVKDTGGSGGEEGGDEGGDGEIIAATVPVELPIVMDLKGNITVPSDAKIINHTKDSNIEVTDIDAFMEADWAAADFNSDFTAKPENAKELGLAFRGDAMGTNQKFALTDGNWVIGKNEGELQLKMEARLPRQSKQAKTKIATVQFTLDLTDKQATDDTDQPAESVISHSWGKDKMLKDSVAPVTFTYDSTASGVSIVSVESDNPAIEVEKSAQMRDLGNLKEEVWSVKAISKGAATVTATLSTGETTAFNVIVYELNIGDGGSITVPEVPNKGEGDRLNTGDIVVDIPVATPDGDDTIQITPVIPPDTVLKPGDNEIDVSAEVDGITINIKIIINIQSSNPSDGLHQSIEEAQAMGFTFSPYENGLQIDSFENKQFKSEINVPEQIGDFKVLKISSKAFMGQTNIKKVTLPDTVKTIGDTAFSGCTNLTSVNIPDGVTSIGNNTFNSCESLTSINIPNGVTSVGAAAFYKCTALTSITLPDSATSIDNSAFALAGSVDSPVTIYCNVSVDKYGISVFSKSNIHEVIIADGITSIGKNAFIDCTGFTSITIPDSVTFIDKNAFSHCTGLISVTIPDNITSISNGTFQQCGNLKQITIPDSVTSIGDYAFSGCKSLTSVIIPDSVTSIGKNAFASCAGLTSLTIPDSVTSIGDYTFFGCKDLTSVIIPNGVTSIGNYAFQDCRGLTSVTIPDSVTSIGSCAFFANPGYQSLTSVIIPDSVTTIGYNAFFNVPHIEYHGTATGAPWGAKSTN